VSQAGYDHYVYTVRMTTLNGFNVDEGIKIAPMKKASGVIDRLLADDSLNKVGIRWMSV